MDKGIKKIGGVKKKMDLFGFLRNATQAGLIQWEPTGEEVETSYGRIKKGYKTTIDGYSVKTIVRARPKGFFKQGWGLGEVAHGIVVEKEGKVFTLTDDPKTIHGQKDESVESVCRAIHHWTENKDLISSLTQSLARLFYA
ncbi:hypothetical protein KAW43_02170 [Candidatus Parcubacteria bacterium]|nr:hypothetical protein [Candidatus Parcubacteria bacterium]